MQREKFKVLLYLKKSGLDKLGQAPIMGRITYGRSMAQFSCKLSCEPDLWNARESRLNGKSHEAVVTNGKLDRLLLSVHSAYRRLCERGAVFTATDIKELFQGSMQSQTTFLERYDRMFEEMEKLVGVEIKASSLYAYRSLESICNASSSISSTLRTSLSGRLGMIFSRSWSIMSRACRVCRKAVTDESLCTPRRFSVWRIKRDLSTACCSIRSK